MKITKLRRAKFPRRIPPARFIDGLAKRLRSRLSDLGFDGAIGRTSRSRIDIVGLRVRPEVRGYNISPYSGHRGRVLGWRDWVDVNNAVNDVLDSGGWSANVVSLAGVFRIRQGTRRFNEDDWYMMGGRDNIGSRMYPIPRTEGWLPEGKVAGQVPMWERFHRDRMGPVERARQIAGA